VFEEDTFPLPDASLRIMERFRELQNLLSCWVTLSQKGLIQVKDMDPGALEYLTDATLKVLEKNGH
jgi:hypothetical protein